MAGGAAPHKAPAQDVALPAPPPPRLGRGGHGPRAGHAGRTGRRLRLQRPLPGSPAAERRRRPYGGRDGPRASLSSLVRRRHLAAKNGSAGAGRESVPGVREAPAVPGRYS